MNRLRCTLFITALVLNVSLSLAWDIEPGLPFVRSVMADSTESRLIVSLERGGVWLSEDSGNSWLPINDNISEDNMTWRLYDIAPLDALADTITIRGYYDSYPSHSLIRQQVMITTDGGHSWSYPHYEGMSNIDEFMIIDNDDHDTFYYISTAYFNYSTDFGSTWSEEQELISEQPYSFIQDVDHDSTLIICCLYHQLTEYGGVLRSNDLGTTWDYLLRPDDYFDGYEYAVLSDIKRLSNNDFLVSVPHGSRPLYSPMNVTLRSIDNGITWNEEHNLPNSFQPYCIIESKQTNGHLFTFGLRNELRGDGGTGYLYESFDYGHTWQPIDEPWMSMVYSPGWIKSNEFTNTIYVGTKGNGAWKSYDDGVSWQPFPTPQVGYSSWINVQNAFVSYAQKMSNKTFIKSINDTSFSSLHYPYPPVDSMQVAYPILAAHGDTLIGMYARRSIASNKGVLNIVQSNDYGLSWDSLITSSPVGDHFSDVAIFYNRDNNQNYIMVSAVAYSNYAFTTLISADGARTWDSIDWVTGLNAYYSKYAVKDGYFYALYPNQDIARRPISGGPVEYLDHPNPTYINYPCSSIIESDVDAIYTLSSVYGYKYLNGEWTQLGILAFPDAAFAAAIPRDGQEPILLLTTKYAPRMAVSYDGGYEWDPVELPYDQQFSHTSEVYYDPWREQVWLSTPLGVMVEDASIFTSVAEERASQPKSFKLLSVYPNPFNDQATVTVHLDRPSEVELTLFNLLGQEVRTLMNERRPAGETQVALDASALASGTYFVRVITQDGAATRKLELVR